MGEKDGSRLSFGSDAASAGEVDCRASFHSSKLSTGVPILFSLVGARPPVGCLGGATRSEKRPAAAAVPGLGEGGAGLLGGDGVCALNDSPNAGAVVVKASPNPAPVAVGAALIGADVLVPSDGHPGPDIASHGLSRSLPPTLARPVRTIRLSSGGGGASAGGATALFEGRPRRIGEIVSARLGPDGTEGSGLDEMTDE